MSKSNSPRSRPIQDILLLLGVLVCVFLVWSLAAYWIDGSVHGVHAPKETDAEARGLFGDKFGAVNALFSGFAFAGIIFTILLQRRDLNQTRDAFEEQTRAAENQRFDNTFFRLLELHNDITSKLDVLGNEGRSAFRTFHEQLLAADEDFPAYTALDRLPPEKIRVIRDTRTVAIADYPELTAADVSNIEVSLLRGLRGIDNYLDSDLAMQERKINHAYTKAASSLIDHYSHYFRNLYHLLRFIDESPLIDDSERKRYAKIVRSQLSEVELLALFYNSLTEITIPGREKLELGYPKMGQLLSKYDVLQNMSPRSLIHHHHRAIFLKNNRSNQQ